MLLFEMFCIMIQFYFHSESRSHVSKLLHLKCIYKIMIRVFVFVVIYLNIKLTKYFFKNDMTSTSPLNISQPRLLQQLSR